MAGNFHTQTVDGTTLVNTAGLDAPIAELDAAIGKFGRVFATCQGIVTQSGTTVSWPAIDIFFHKDSTGDLIRNKLPAHAGLAIANGYGLVITLNEADGTTLGAATSGNVIDLDGVPTTLDGSAGIPKVILLARSPLGTGTGLLHYVVLRPPQPLRGASTLAVATTTVVTFPTGYTLQSNGYQVVLMPTAAGFWAKDPCVTTKAVGSFTLTHATGAGEAFDWMIVGN